MRIFVYILFTSGSVLTWGQKIQLAFNPFIDNDTLKVDIIAHGDHAVELGSSNFVFNIEGEALNLTSVTFDSPEYSSTSYSMWNYIHTDDFEHVLLSRTHRPKNLVLISKLKIGELSYPILDKCKPVSIKWDTKKGDIRSHWKSIKKDVVFRDTSFTLVKPIEEPVIIEQDNSNSLSITSILNHQVEWFKDGELIASQPEISNKISGIYYATVSNGCETKTSQPYRVERVLQNKEELNPVVTTLFPNPVLDKMTLIIDASKISNIDKVVLINELGQELRELSNTIHGPQTIFNVGKWNLPKGVYFVKILNGEDSEILRFVY